MSLLDGYGAFAQLSMVGWLPLVESNIVDTFSVMMKANNWHA